MLHSTNTVIDTNDSINKLIQLFKQRFELVGKLTVVDDEDIKIIIPYQGAYMGSISKGKNELIHDYLKETFRITPLHVRSHPYFNEVKDTHILMKKSRIPEVIAGLEKKGACPKPVYFYYK